MPEEILIVAAEASADALAAVALAELRRLRPGVQAFGVGGPRLREAGLDALHRAEDLSVMGLAEVLPRIPRVLAVLRDVPAAARRRRPRAALLVDSPDLNLRLGRRLRGLGVKVLYYVSPMIWAWRRGRARRMARAVDRMLCLLPFEERLYRGTGVSARFVGHPLADGPAPSDPAVYRRALGLGEDGTVVALLPGSRPAELRRIFPPMLAAAERIRARHPGARFLVPVAPTLRPESARAFLAAHPALDVRLLSGRALEALGASDAALVKSGTATLEAAQMLRPMVVVYRMSPPSYLAARLLVRVAHVALVNILAGRRLVPELLQREASPDRMASEIERLLADPGARRAQLEGLAEVRAALGPPGAARRVAEEIDAALTV